MKPASSKIVITLAMIVSLGRAAFAAPSPIMLSEARNAIEKAYRLQNEAVKQKNINFSFR